MILIDDLKADELVKMTDTEKKGIWSGFTTAYARCMRDSVNGNNGLSGYNPQAGQSALNSVSSTSYMPTSSEVEKYLKNPESYSKQLREISNYFDMTIMQYKRTMSHFRKVLSFRYDLRLLQDYEKEELVSVKNANKRCNDFLRDFNVPYHTKMIMDKVVVNGGGFYYLQKTNDYTTLLEMPVDFCYVTGRWDRGLTYAIDLTFFDRYINMKRILPEMYEYYKVFMDARDCNASNSKMLQYYAVPIEDGFVFTFDANDVYMIPPFSGIFRDATAIFTYKNLLMQRTALETWKVIAQKIPLDKNDVPILSGEQAQIFVDFAQSVLPSGTAVFATPMEIHEVDFSKGASGQNNITGMGEELFWRSVGVNGGLMDATDKSSATMKYSLINDESFADNIYQQMADFINLQLRISSRKYRFGVKFYGNKYLEEETIKLYKDALTTTNGLVGKLYGLMGYEPFEVLPNLKLENDLGYKDNMLPIIAGYQQSEGDESGRKEKDVSNLTDSGLETRDSGSNSDRGDG